MLIKPVVSFSCLYTLCAQNGCKVSGFPMIDKTFMLFFLILRLLFPFLPLLLCLVLCSRLASLLSVRASSC